MNTTRDFARSLDEQDELRAFRDKFSLPLRADGSPLVYFAGNSLGLSPKTTPAVIGSELEKWAQLGVEGHFAREAPWYSYHQLVRDASAHLIGARPEEVVIMNTLTVNLHLMMVSFYRPTRDRYAILVDHPTFPSDLYAVKSQLRFHGQDSSKALIRAEPRPGEHTVRMEDFEELFHSRGKEIALVLINGVNFFTGQAFDIKRVVALAHRAGARIGIDLAHSVGNVPLELHDAGPDFAAWCNYKYLNSGPGAIAGCFVHERHLHDSTLQRFSGWWGNDPETRFEMGPDFVPVPSADGWAVSNPPIFSLAPLRSSLALFDQATMPKLRKKSCLMSQYFDFLTEDVTRGEVKIITPKEAPERGAQISMLVDQNPEAFHQALLASGIVCDFRKPNVVRVAPTPLYNTFQEIWQFADILKRHVGK